MSHPTTKHYGQEASFFEGFLDPYMKYSSSVFEREDETLDVAVQRALDTHIDLGRVRDGARVLDIGNGWGCFLKRVFEVRTDIAYTGVNPSKVQLEYIERNVRHPATMHNAPFEDVMDALEPGFDTIYLIGALCHMQDKQRVLERVNALLADGGRVVLEDTFFLSEDIYRHHHDHKETHFVQDDVFGFAHIHSLSRHLETVRAAGFRVMSAFDNSDSYARSIEIWTDRLLRMDPKQFPHAMQFAQYMDVAQRGWGYTICNHMMALEKLPRRRPRRIAAPWEGHA
jgi:cyclopropane-fatty-acyl-phospholipid synthase